MASYSEEQITALFDSLREDETTLWNAVVGSALPRNMEEDAVSDQIIDTSARQVGMPLLPMPRTSSASLPSPNIGTTIRNLQGIVAKRLAATIPNCLRGKSRALFYKAAVEYSLQNKPAERRDDILRAISSIKGCTWQYPQMHESVVEWVAQQLNVIWPLAALILGDLLGMKPENLYCRFPRTAHKQ